MQNSYKEFSQIYDLLMDMDYEKWTSFIMKKLKGKRKILEAACGTGGITKLLADNNYKVTAFDLSEDMLMRAYEKLAQSPMVRLLNQNMVDFEIDEIMLSFRVPGQIVERPVNEGQTLASGTMIARLDSEEFRLAVARAAATLESDRAALAELENGSRAEEKAQALAQLQQAELISKAMETR